MIYVLSSSNQIFSVAVRAQESRQGDGAASAHLALSLKQSFSNEVFDEQQRYLNNAAIAAYVSFNKIDQRNRFKASVKLTPELDKTGNFSFIQGSSSSGLGYALALFDAWWREILSKPTLGEMAIFCTGEIGRNGEIKPISYQNEKISAVMQLAEQQKISNFTICLPKSNQADVSASLVEDATRLGAKFIFVDRLQELLVSLYVNAYDGDPLGRWEPFKGLLSFNYEDSLRFFGRKKDVVRLYSDLNSNDGVLIVSGQSGSGKSSLIKAGLIPYLAEKEGHILWFSVTPKELDSDIVTNFFANLAKLKQIELTTDELNYLSESFNQGTLSEHDFVNKLQLDDNKIVYHVDQLEEIYTSQASDNNANQVQVLQALAKLSTKVKVIVSIRNEYLVYLLDSGYIQSPVISNVSGSLDFDSWREVVEDQAAFSGFEFEVINDRPLSYEIIEQASKTQNALPMVEYVLQQLADKAKTSSQPSLLTYHDFQSMGGLVGAIASRAQMAIANACNNPTLIHHLFSLLVGITNDQRPYVKTLLLHDRLQLKEDLQQLLQNLIDANILVSESDDQINSGVRLAHDSLLTHWFLLTDWLKQQSAYLNWRQAIDYDLRAWSKSLKKKEVFIKDKDLLNQARNYLKQGLLVEPDLVDYVNKSISAKSTKEGLLVSGIVASLVLIAAAIPSHQLSLPDHVNINELSCNIGSSDKPSFEGMVLNEKQAKEFLSQFCQVETFKSRYSSIVLKWSSYDHSLNIEKLRAQKYSLFVDSDMSVTKEDNDRKYRKLAKFPDYDVFFISKFEHQKIGSKEIAGKTLGLIDKVYSTSGRRIPEDYLSSLNISNSMIKFEYYSSHYELRKALINGEVDLISSYYDNKVENELTEKLKIFYKSNIGNSAGVAWYIPENIVNDKIGCYIEKFIKQQAKDSPSAYFRYPTFMIEQSCNE
jgi:hypothetical protein